MERKRDKPIRVSEQIATQGRISNSNRPFEQVVGTLYIAGQLNERFSGLTDRQIGQLLSDVVWNRLELLSPETAICAGYSSPLPVGKWESDGGGQSRLTVAPRYRTDALCRQTGLSPLSF